MKRGWLIDARNRKEKSQTYVAIATGMSQQHYSLIENGERCPSPKNAQAIAAVLGFDWTLFYQDNAHKNILPGKEASNNDQRLRHSI